MVEVGRKDDLSIQGLVGRDVFKSYADAKAAQGFLASAANEVASYSLRPYTVADHRHVLVADSGEVCVGVLEPEFTEDLMEAFLKFGKGNVLTPDLFGDMNTQMSGDSVVSPRSLTPVRSYGCSTLVASPDQDWSGELHEPWAISGFVLAPRIAALASF